MDRVMLDAGDVLIDIPIGQFKTMQKGILKKSPEIATSPDEDE